MILTINQIGVAACILDNLDDATAARALGMRKRTVEAIIRRLMTQTGAQCRDALYFRLSVLARSPAYPCASASGSRCIPTSP